MSADVAEIVKLLSYFGLMLGLIGTVAPILPGPALVWLSALVWAWADGFERVGWPTLAVMAVLAVLATVADLLLSTYGGRRGGAAWSSLALSSVLAILGFLAFSLPGAIVAALAGVLLAEWRRHGQDWRRAWQSSKGMLLGWVASFFVQLALVLLMLLVFTLQAFGPA